MKPRVRTIIAPLVALACAALRWAQGVAAPPPIVVPFDIVGGHIFVNARLNGAAPMRFAVDTGAGDVLAADDAQALGLREGRAFTVYGTGESAETAHSTQVDAVELGGAVLRGQHFTVLPFAELRAAEGIARFDGLIGHELFDRYVVRIDYVGRTMTLYDRSDSAPFDDRSADLALTFHGTMPEITAEVDGLAGSFTIDTGDRGSLSLLVPFVVKNALENRYRPTVEGIAGWGIGGPVRAKLTRVADFRLGGFDVHDLVTRLPEARHGFFTGRSVAGNIGYGVLRRFTLTFDYAHRRLQLAPNEDFANPDVVDRSGMWLVLKPDGFGVAGVVANGPAAVAGVREGDVIESIDGRPSSEIPLPAEREALAHEPLGTRITLHLKRESQSLDVVVTLRDIV